MSISVYQEKLFRQFRHALGAPLVGIEVEDETLCSLLEMCIEDYAQYVQEWLVENQWQSVYGKSISTTDLSFALSVRSLDYTTQFTYAYSKQVGLQTRGPWELKKDFIDVEAGRQVYVIPANREVNEVLYMSPPTMNRALFANMGGGMDTGFGGGIAQAGAGSSGMGGAGYYLTPAFDALLLAGDMNLKNRMLKSDLVYKITAGPNGTRLLHLLSTPGSHLSFGSVGGAGIGSSQLAGCKVWYHYYETAGDADMINCRKENSDIILLPNEVPLAELDVSTFNEPTKTLIRKLFIAEGKRTLGRTRGKYGGIIGPPEAERTMDYESLLSEGNEEKTFAMDRLNERLIRMSSSAQLEKAANDSENLNKSLKFRPMGFYVK